MEFVSLIHLNCSEFIKPVARLFAVVAAITGFTMCDAPAENKPDNSVPVGPTEHFDTTLVDPMDTLQDLRNPQAVLDDFLARFATIKKLPSLRYESAYEYESQQLYYFYEDSQLRGVFKDHGIEGGGGGHLHVALSHLPDGSISETILYVPYFSEFEKGYFCYPENNQLSWFEVSGDEDFYHPKIVGACEEQFYEYETSLHDYREKIRGNKSNFTSAGGVYRWDLRREKVNSEYGEIEIYETILVDSVIFTDQF